MPNGNADEHIDCLLQELSIAEECIKDFLLVLTPEQEAGLTESTREWITKERRRQQESEQRKIAEDDKKLLRDIALSKLTEEELDALRD